jgi:hypothetical protein
MSPAGNHVEIYGATSANHGTFKLSLDGAPAIDLNGMAPLFRAQQLLVNRLLSLTYRAVDAHERHSTCSADFPLANTLSSCRIRLHRPIPSSTSTRSSYLSGYLLAKHQAHPRPSPRQRKLQQTRYLQQARRLRQAHHLQLLRTSVVLVL